MYWIFAVFTVLMIAVLGFTRFPRVERTSEEGAGSLEMYGSLLREPMVWAFFLCVFAYVGCEQGTADSISKFLAQYHGYDPHTTGATAVSWFWGMLTAGCFVGMGLLKLFDSRRVLIAFCIGALFCLTAALFGRARVSLIAFPAIGLFASIVASAGFAGIEFGFRTPRAFRWNLEHGDHGRGGGAGDHRSHWRFRWSARRCRFSVRNLRMRS